jgi:hypothetical protein
MEMTSSREIFVHDYNSLSDSKTSISKEHVQDVVQSAKFDGHNLNPGAVAVVVILLLKVENKEINDISKWTNNPLYEKEIKYLQFEYPIKRISQIVGLGLVQLLGINKCDIEIAPITLIDERTGRRVPYEAEMKSARDRAREWHKGLKPYYPESLNVRVIKETLYEAYLTQLEYDGTTNLRMGDLLLDNNYRILDNNKSEAFNEKAQEAFQEIEKYKSRCLYVMKKGFKAKNHRNPTSLEIRDMEETVKERIERYCQTAKSEAERDWQGEVSTEYDSMEVGISNASWLSDDGEYEDPREMDSAEIGEEARMISVADRAAKGSEPEWSHKAVLSILKRMDPRGVGIATQPMTFNGISLTERNGMFVTEKLGHKSVKHSLKWLWGSKGKLGFLSHPCLTKEDRELLMDFANQSSIYEYGQYYNDSHY